jgi:DNA repair ATPase RecN
MTDVPKRLNPEFERLHARIAKLKDQLRDAKTDLARYRNNAEDTNGELNARLLSTSMHKQSLLVKLENIRELADEGARWVRQFHPGHSFENPYFPGCMVCQFLQRHDKEGK